MIGYKFTERVFVIIKSFVNIRVYCFQSLILSYCVTDCDHYINLYSEFIGPNKNTIENVLKNLNSTSRSLFRTLVIFLKHLSEHLTSFLIYVSVV